MAVINTNISALKAANASTSADKLLGTAMERLSTGKRINSAKDDAAGMAIATSMTAQVRGMNQGIRNANDGIALAQTAEGALNEVTNMLQRIRELAVQSSSGTYTEDDRGYMQTEVNELTAQIKSTIDNTEFNGVKLFKPADGSESMEVSIQTGANSADTVTLNLVNLAGEADDDGVYTGGLNAMNYGAETTAQGEPIVDDDGEPVLDADGNPTFEAGETTTTVSYNVGDATSASNLLDTIDAEMKTISDARSNLGAEQTRLEAAVSTMTSTATNLSDARSRIEDTDYSAETTALAKAQILSQASTAMLSQANQSQQNVMSLLR